MKERIKQLRKTLSFTQQEFAERIGVKRNTIAQYEIGRNEPIESVINLICKEYNVNPDWLRNGIGEMFVDPSTFSLDEYAQANSLTKTEISIIRNFMELEPSVRKAIYHIFENVASLEYNDNLKNNEFDTPETTTELSTEEYVDTYRDYVETKKKATEKLSS